MRFGIAQYCQAGLYASLEFRGTAPRKSGYCMGVTAVPAFCDGINQGNLHSSITLVQLIHKEICCFLRINIPYGPDDRILQFRITQVDLQTLHGCLASEIVKLADEKALFQGILPKFNLLQNHCFPTNLLHFHAGLTEITRKALNGRSCFGVVACSGGNDQFEDHLHAIFVQAEHGLHLLIQFLLIAGRHLYQQVGHFGFSCSLVLCCKRIAKQ